MSYIKPDYDYNPLDKMFLAPEKTDEPPIKMIFDKSFLISSIKEFSKSIPDFNIHRFYGNTALSFRTNTNVFDSIAFFKKFSDAYFFSLKKTFPHISENEMQKIEKNFQELQNSLEEILNHSNVENKYLLALSLGMLESMLDYENY